MVLANHLRPSIKPNLISYYTNLLNSIQLQWSFSFFPDTGFALGFWDNHAPSSSLTAPYPSSFQFISLPSKTKYLVSAYFFPGFFFCSFCILWQKGKFIYFHNFYCIFESECLSHTSITAYSIYPLLWPLRTWNTSYATLTLSLSMHSSAHNGTPIWLAVRARGLHSFPLCSGMVWLWNVLKFTCQRLGYKVMGFWGSDWIMRAQTSLSG